MNDHTAHPPMTQAQADETSSVDAKDEMCRVIVAGEDSYTIETITDSLRGMATVAAIEPQIDIVEELIDNLDADLLVLDLDARPSEGENLLDIVRTMKQRRPALPIITFGDSLSAHLVLSVMRAGAVDFVDRETTPEEARAQIASHLHRHHDRKNVKAQAMLHVLCSAREDLDSTIATVNLASFFASKGQRTLLIDLSTQGDEAALALGLEPTYMIEDALLDLPRLDETLLLGALCHHKEIGLYLLPLHLVNSNSLSTKDDLDPAVLNAMLTLIRPFFEQIVINASGRWLGVGLAPLLSISSVGVAFDYLVVQPNLVSVSGASRLIREVFGQAEADEISKTGLRLLLVNEEPAQTLSGEEIAETLGLPYAGSLPAAPLHHPDAVNEGVPLVIAAPRNSYSARLREVLVGEYAIVEEPSDGLVGRLRGMLGRG